MEIDRNNKGAELLIMCFKSPWIKGEVIIPNKDVEKAGFKEGDELKAVVKKGEVRLIKKWLFFKKVF